MKLTERLMRAENGGQGNEDLLGAAGLASVDHPLGSALQRALSTLRHSDAERVVEHFLEEDDHVKRVKIVTGQRRLLVRAAVRVWINPVCVACHGRGFGVVEGTTHLNDVACSVCQGTGKMMLNFPGPEGALVSYVGARMDAAFARFEKRLASKLGRG